jgi:hypothetical protein
LIKNNIKFSSIQSLYNSFLNDIAVELNIIFFNLPFLLQIEYQDPLNILLLLSPEVLFVFLEYFNIINLNILLNSSPSIVFDSYTNNLNFYYGEGILQFFLFFFYIYFIVYFFSS